MSNIALGIPGLGGVQVETIAAYWTRTESGTLTPRALAAGDQGALRKEYNLTPQPPLLSRFLINPAINRDCNENKPLYDAEKRRISAGYRIFDPGASSCSICAATSRAVAKSIAAKLERSLGRYF